MFGDARVGGDEEAVQDLGRREVGEEGLAEGVGCVAEEGGAG